MSKRFLVTAQTDLRDVERQVAELEADLADSRENIVKAVRQAAAHYTGHLTRAFAASVTRRLQERNVNARKVENAVQSFLDKVADKHQPAQKLRDATINALRRISANEMMTDPHMIDSIPPIARDRRIILGGRAAQLQAQSILITDRLLLTQVLKSTPARGASINLSSTARDQLVTPFFNDCTNFVANCSSAETNLPKLAVEASLNHAATARLYETYCRATNTDIPHASAYVASAKALLEKAKEYCTLGFSNADALLGAVEESLRLLGREWYEEVSAEEIAAVKKAMLSAGSGGGGIDTHSGHWYNCANGHPVSRVFLTFLHSSLGSSFVWIRKDYQLILWQLYVIFVP